MGKLRSPELRPPALDDLIPGDPQGRTWGQLNHWLRSQGSSLFALFTEQVGTISSRKKAILIDMAKRGEERPSQDSLNHSLGNYTNKTQTRAYDASFDSEIRSLAPAWFVDSTERAAGTAARKQQLLDLAKRGVERPKALTKYLSSYTDKRGHSYDVNFDAEIRKLAPSWFTDANAVSRKKRKILTLAKRGVARAAIGALRSCLSRYTNKGGAYDAKFDREVRKLAPLWFVSTATLDKQQIIDMATNGSARPHHTSKLGKHLMSYTNATSTAYDSAFTNKIRSIRPDWFQKKWFRKAA